MFSQQNMPKTKTVLSAVASVAASAMLIRTIANDFVPGQVQNYFSSTFHNISRHFSSELTIVIEELNGHSLNEIFDAVDTYLGTKVTPSVQRIRVRKDEKDKKVAVTMDKDEEIVDLFEDVEIRCRLICEYLESTRSRHHGDYNNTTSQTEIRSYELSFHKKHKEKVLDSYLPYVLERSKVIKEESKVIKLHTVDYRCWDSNTINLDHPMTFKTLAMDSELKKELVDDLNNFMEGKEYYRQIGKAWKRGYLLYGPPGTGKSSLIAAMANHLNCDIYDLDLTDVESNSDLRVLLLSMSKRSILVIEDIDCSIKLENRDAEDETGNHHQNQQVTLSGLLNFIDGLWSCCGDGRVIVFTTNHKDKLDPALLRPGRMDVHVHMTYCTISAFKQLAFNYLRIVEHKLFEQIEELITKIEVTPAEVAGKLMKSTDADVSLQGLLKFLQNKLNEHEKTKIKEDVKSQREKEEKEKEDQVKRQITL